MMAVAGPTASELLASMQTAVMAIAPDGRITLTNPAAETLLNMSAQFLRGRMLSDVMTLPSGFDILTDGPVAAHEVEIATVRGGRITIDIEVSQLLDWAGWRMLALRGGSIAQKMGHRSDRAGGGRSAVGVAAILAHEIKNPLAGIRGAAQLVESSLADSDRRMTQLIRSEVDRITALVDQMEGFTDTRPMERSPANVHQIIDDARAIAVNGFGSALQVSDAYDPSLPPVLVHRDSLIQVLLNLLKNAAETAPQSGVRKVILTTAYRQGVSVAVPWSPRKVPLPIELCVIDDGPGVPNDMEEAMFEPFVTTKKSGRGLGLALADKLTRDTGGILQYAREGEPPLTVFRLLLPRAPERSAS
jgi:two-component system, NtrC family, nitrogen regulation sensor histidine kinase GlnL